MNITEYTIEELHDPTGILEGHRYEFFLEIEVPEGDELFSEDGLLLRVIFAEANGEKNILHYEFIERNTNNILDFALEEDEEELVLDFCIQHYQEA
ncbi:DUF6509 family protein [Lederbergia galactosidilytica]|uniref:Pullulanase n=1 Tax=Lederbergia galactosidilytica TaxID=217031 RepID=A0A0Q9Y1C8_9BACI|nr:DUF6509 family protein [Lederbergia galactosidilytica]KRG09477.1 pullulanase [Virgibacillus soli]KRG10574.1 pullulanase [Lederbergia galactosidilytica]MBP1913489.1 hypothetical protein [Lederbergia galactosidilytica]OAK72189.1 pullulanase [Lederbergia galactosidilytica]